MPYCHRCNAEVGITDESCPSCGYHFLEPPTSRPVGLARRILRSAVTVYGIVTLAIVCITLLSAAQRASYALNAAVILVGCLVAAYVRKGNIARLVVKDTVFLFGAVHVFFLVMAVAIATMAHSQGIDRDGILRFFGFRGSPDWRNCAIVSFCIVVAAAWVLVGSAIRKQNN